MTNKNIHTGFGPMDAVFDGYPAMKISFVFCSGKENIKDDLQRFILRQALNLGTGKRGRPFSTLIMSLRDSEENLTKKIIEEAGTGTDDIREVYASPISIQDIRIKDADKISATEKLHGLTDPIDINVISKRYDVIIVDGIDEIFKDRNISRKETIGLLRDWIQESLTETGVTVILADYDNAAEYVPDNRDDVIVTLSKDVLGRTQATIHDAAGNHAVEDIYGHPMESRGVFVIDAERRRQLYQEGYDSRHDREHVRGELADGAAVYAMTEESLKKYMLWSPNPDVPSLWPFEEAMYKPTPNNRIRQLAKAGAMIAAEIDRLMDKENESKQS